MALDTDFIVWSIDARKAIQSAMLNLSLCYTNEDPFFNKLKIDNHFARFGELTGIGFSLWRAAFLASMGKRPRFSTLISKGEQDAVESASYTKHASDLLRTVLQSNAVTFVDDRRTEHWMGEYYIDNAAFRLERYISKWGKGDPTAHVKHFQHVWNEEVVKIEEAAPARIWMDTYHPFADYVKALMNDVDVAPASDFVTMKPELYKFVNSTHVGPITSQATSTVSN